MKIGMVGGIGPESTVDYYQRIIRQYRQTMDNDGYPEIIVNSINMTGMLEYVARQDWDGLTRLLTDAVRALHAAGADFAFIASNTPHVIFSRVLKACGIPLVSIVEAACSEAAILGLKKVGLLGTRFTMQSRYYQDEFDKAGISVVVPDDEEQRYIEQKLFSEIEHGVFLDDTRQGLLGIVRRMLDDERIDGIVLGCTELPLILTRDEFGIPFLNTTGIHVDRILEYYQQIGVR